MFGCRRFLPFPCVGAPMGGRPEGRPRFWACWRRPARSWRRRARWEWRARPRTGCGGAKGRTVSPPHGMPLPARAGRAGCQPGRFGKCPAGDQRSHSMTSRGGRWTACSSRASGRGGSRESSESPTIARFCGHLPGSTGPSRHRRDCAKGHTVSPVLTRAPGGACDARLRGAIRPPAARRPPRARGRSQGPTWPSCR